LWPLSVFAKRRVQKLLQSYSTKGVSDPQIDLPKIRSMQTQLARISANPLADQVHLWNGLDTATDKLREHLTTAKEARQAIVDLGKSLGNLPSMSSKLHSVLATDSSNHPVHRKSQAFLESAQRFSASVQAFKSFAGAAPVNKTTRDVLIESFSVVEKIRKDRPSLQRWTAWSGVKQR
jgi:hypothetical protein